LSTKRKYSLKLFATEMDCLRRPARISRLARSGNKTIRTKMRVREDILQETEE
jgi:hypothetical protein